MHMLLGALIPSSGPGARVAPRRWTRPVLGLWVPALIALGPLSRADMPGIIDSLRGAGCTRTAAPSTPLHHDPRLDASAQRWGRGLDLQGALALSGYAAASSSGLHVTGGDSDAAQILRQAGCRTIADPTLRDWGYYRRGTQAWLVFAIPYRTLSAAQSPAVAAQVLDLVNTARLRGAHCGTRQYPPAPALHSSSLLNAVAARHAADMAAGDYLDHVDPQGRTPADRVRAAGYRDSLVGENIAYGPSSAPEVVQGWLASPGHCENLLTAPFSEMGIAFAAGRDRNHFGLYWVQLLAQPRAASSKRAPRQVADGPRH